MKHWVVLFLSFTILSSCTHRSEQKDNSQPEKITETNPFPLVGKRIVTSEIAGSAYIIRAEEYFIISNSDTSGFKPVFIEWKDSNKVGIDLDLPYSNNTEIWDQRLKELELILPLAAKDFNLDSLHNLSVGRLVLTGDLAVSITKEYKNKFGENEKITTADYRKISDFLLQSQLAGDFNKLFNPFGISVENISIEKAFFTKREELFKLGRITRDSSEVPDKILDCITWVIFTSHKPL